MVSRHLGLHYGAMSLYTTVLHNLFLLYHIEMFVSVYKIDKFSFWVGETIFLIWNSCNDPLFGWISDRKFLLRDTDNSHVVASRLRALTWNGPLFCLSFIAFWVSWTFPSLQFVVCLCAYDGFLTMIDLHHTALLADLSISAAVRTDLNMYCSVFSALGSMSVFLSYAVWSSESLIPFQIFCICLAVTSVVGFLFSARTLEKSYRPSDGKSSCVEKSSADSSDTTKAAERSAMKLFIRGLAGHKNFMWFTAMNLVQVFHCHFNSNFFPLFLEILIGDSVSPVVCSILLGVSFVAPHINNLYFLSLCRRYGAYSVIKLLFGIKLAISCVMLFTNTSHLWILCLFIASNRVFTEGTCKLLNLVISDLVDEDAVLHRRRQAVSALMFGTVAFLSKPGQTLAPLIGTYLLSIYTGHDVFETGKDTGSLKLNAAVMTDDMKAGYQLGVFHLLVYVPVICAVMQLLFWSQFNLHGKRLEFVKHVRNGIGYAVV